MTRALLALATLALLAVPAAALGPGAPGAHALGGGIWTGGGPLCAHTPAPAPVVIEATQQPDNGWVVALQSPGDGPCMGLAADVCRGTGSLQGGIALHDCAPFGREGLLGPMRSILACVTSPCETVVAGPIAYHGFGGYDGEVVMAAAPRVLA